MAGCKMSMVMNWQDELSRPFGLSCKENVPFKRIFSLDTLFPATGLSSGISFNSYQTF